MPNNNPNGTNSWEGFGTEEPYGQQTQDAALQTAAPLAGGKISAGPIRAPKQDQKQAAAPTGPPVIPEAPQQTSPAEEQRQADAAVWQQLAQHPDASDLVRAYAAQA